MSSLAREYTNRHGLKSINTINDGVIYYNAGNNNYLICLISSHGRGLIACHDCSFKLPYLTLEVYEPQRTSNGAMSYRGIHAHINPEDDLLECLGKLNLKIKFKYYKPFLPTSAREQEIWLWNLTLSFANKGLVQKLQNSKHTDFISQFTWAALNTPGLVGIYSDLYAKFLLNKNYILF